MLVKLQYTPSNTLRQTHLVQTGEPLPGAPSLTVNLADLTPEQRQIIVAAGIDDRDGSVRMPQPVTGLEPDYAHPGRVRFATVAAPAFDHEPTVEEWLAQAAAGLATRDALQPDLEAHNQAAREREQAEKQLRAQRERDYAALIDVWMPRILRLSEDDLAAGMPAEIIEAERGGQFYKRLTLSQEWRERHERLAAERLAAERETAKQSWIAAHGSDHLRRGAAAGHDCQRLYVTERAALEAPGYTVDFDDTARWKDRSCPSLAALDERDRMTARGIGSVEIVWLTAAPTASVRDDYDGYEDGFAPCEAVIVRGYLSKYDLVKII